MITQTGLQFIKQPEYSNAEIRIDRKQFPVVPAEAITIHKSQGATYSKVAVHLKRGIKLASLYVGCSRATSASGLLLLGDFVPPTRFGATNVLVELERLRGEKALNTRYEFLVNENEDNSLYYHNVESIRAHREDVANDNIICSANFLCFVETWTLPQEEYT